MLFELDESTFILYAMKNYDNPYCKGLEEFEDDLRRFSYLKRLFKKYTAGKGLKERLIINHLVVLNNLFGPEASTKMLFFKIEEKHWAQLKTFLVFLNMFPIGVKIYKDNRIIEGFQIEMDETVLASLMRL